MRLPISWPAAAPAPAPITVPAVLPVSDAPSTPPTTAPAVAPTWAVVGDVEHAALARAQVNNNVVVIFFTVGLVSS